ncbi:asparagine synthase (glutamine-hydrolyzing) [Thermococcus piezophilus]|uniref:asparagine synthase (glutamine-hydrolyzing) n=1 Tax=Thermococcus piezophilus TaxID=1712654 RepID=UPI0009ED7CC2|nr:asparagine synthase (glutamine-hydrolyzing) [Thermococcus piezophilus]
MCGINGFSWSDESLINKMNASIRHRGPDDEGVYVDDNVSLGHVRLAIIDLSPRGHQPMRYEKDGKEVWIVYNGEIYNFMELRKELKKKGYTFNSNTDTEVILAAYLEWGFDCVKKFNGMWAFAIYDKSRNILFLSRDRFGIKPLYYYYNGQNIIFSSEIKAILTHNIERKPNDAIVFDFLYYNLLDHTEDTFFDGIKKLMPGHNCVFDLESRNLRIWRYYDLKTRISTSKVIKDNIPERFREIFFKAVKRRLIADVPVGSCLSGGLDSSSIVCAMRHLNPESEIMTFSLVFPRSKFDESKYQSSVVQKCSVKRFTTTFTVDDIIRDIDDLIYIQEEPFPTLSIYGQYMVMKLAHEKGIKVLLDGQGSDEILAGYHYFFGYYFAELFRKLQWRELFREIIAYYTVHKSTSPLISMIFHLFPKFIKHLLWKRRFKYISESFVERYKHRNSKDLVWSIKTLREALILAETYYSLPHLLRFEDKNSMRWSIESRVPFCDYELVEYVLSLPSQEILKKGITKRVLREALKDILPEDIRNRISKIGFATPDKGLLRTERGYRFAKSIIESDRFKKRKYWKADVIKKMLEEHYRGKEDHSQELWKVIIFRTLAQGVV